MYQPGTPWNSSQVQTAQSLFANVNRSMENLAKYESLMTVNQLEELQEMASKYSSMNDSVKSMSTLTSSQMSTLNGQASDLEDSAETIAASVF